jgi:hypothetical protein
MTLRQPTSRHGGNAEIDDEEAWKKSVDALSEVLAGP